VRTNFADSTDAEFLIALAQNDYMIDVNMLPDGERLYKIADRIEALEAALAKYEQDDARYLERLRELQARVPDPDDVQMVLHHASRTDWPNEPLRLAMLRLRATLPTTKGDARAAYRSKPAWGAGPEDVELEPPRLGPAKGEDDDE